MDLRTFLATVLPASGQYFAVYRDHKDTWHTSRPLVDLDALVAITTQYKSKGFDAFFATASFSKGRRQRQGVRYKRVFYVDIDCKEDGQYPTKQEAIAAIKAALAAGMLPPTLIVDSGNGFHLYWVIGQDLKLREWDEYAAALQQACKHYQLNIDQGITIDATRILRTPTSINYKNPDDPKVCKLIHESNKIYPFSEFNEAFGRFLTGPVGVPGTGASTSTIDNSDLSSGLGSSRKAQASLMIPECPVLAESLATRGAGQPGTLWHKILHLLAYCEDGESYIHQVSDGHATYSADATNVRFAYSKQHAGVPGDRLGPTTCTKFAELSAQCQSCKWAGRIKSPIKLGFGIPSDLPWPYRNGDKGVEIRTEEGDWEQVIRYQVKDLQAAVDRSSATYVNFTVAEERIDTDMSSFVDTRSAQGLLCKYAVPLDPHEIEHLKRLMNAWIQQIRNTSSLSTMVQQLGWVSGGGFHFDGAVHMPDGSATPTFRADKVLSEIYSTHGDLAEWTKRANHVLSQPRHASWAVIASAFAAPILGFTGIDGALLSIISPDSGSGKSIVLRIAQAVWGNPLQAMTSLNDTANAVSNKLGMLHNLPAYWDEVRERNEVVNFIRVIFRLSQGKDKHRLNSHIQQRHVGSWSTMLVMASNEPIRDHIAATVANSDAGAARILELKAFPVDKSLDGMDDATARHFYKGVQQNYGHAGLVYAKFLATNRDLVEKKVQAVDQAFSTAFNTTGDERFWVATIASLLVGAGYANQLGLCKFDLAALKTYLISEFLAARIHKTTHFMTGLPRALAVLERFLREKEAYTVRCDLLPNKGVNGMITGGTDARTPISVRYADVENKIRFVLKDFTDWIYEKDGAGYSDIVGALVAAGAVERRVSVNAGLPVGMPTRHPCLEIPLTGPFAVLKPTDD